MKKLLANVISDALISIIIAIIAQKNLNFHNIEKKEVRNKSIMYRQIMPGQN